jgi:ABC-type nitrate/sulfonate/bicarbonate transport system ATPase subunit
MNNDLRKIEIRNIGHRFLIPDTKESMKVIDDISFTVNFGEILCIIGPSGCGKTTLLRMIAGLLLPEIGKIMVDNIEVTKPSSDRILLFQELYLFHWLTVYGNINFVFEAKNNLEPLNNKKINSIIDAVGLKGFENYYPHEISGGMRQRLALGRAMAGDPSILLLDEPFNSLDATSKLELETEYIELHKRKKITSIIVTHDVRQAIYLGDRIIVMGKRPGKISEIVDISSLGVKSINSWQTNEFHNLEVELTNKIQS